MQVLNYIIRKCQPRLSSDTKQSMRKGDGQLWKRLLTSTNTSTPFLSSTNFFTKDFRPFVDLLVDVSNMRTLPSKKIASPSRPFAAPDSKPMCESANVSRGAENSDSFPNEPWSASGDVTSTLSNDPPARKSIAASPIASSLHASIAESNSRRALAMIAMACFWTAMSCD